MVFELIGSVKLITTMMRHRPSLSLKNKNMRKNGDGSGNKKKTKSQVLEGVYHVTPADDKREGKLPRNQNSSKTLDTLIMSEESSSSDYLGSSSSTSSTFSYTSSNDGQQESSSSTKDSSSSCSSRSSCWVSSGSPTHHNGSPRLVRTTSQRNLDLSDDEIMGRVMLKSRTLPNKRNGYFVSNHVMINNERTKRTIVPLKRKQSLDEIAKEHATSMANQGQLVHPQLDDLQQQPLPKKICDIYDFDGYNLYDQQQQRLGVNVGFGCNIEQIQKAMISSESNLNNIIDRRFVYMGIGTAKSSDGTMYLCQIFGN